MLAMYNRRESRFASIETSCGLLLLELQKIWDEVGVDEEERDKMLYQIEQECLEVYKGKVDKANNCRSELKRQIVLAEAEIESLCSALDGELHANDEQNMSLNLNEKLKVIKPKLDEMRNRKAERLNQFVEVAREIKIISNEIFGQSPKNSFEIVVDDNTNLSLKTLMELHNQLQQLQNDKIDRLKQVMLLVDTLNSLCTVLGTDFKHTMHDVHPSFSDSDGFKDITDSTIQRLTTALHNLQDVKMQRIKKIRDLGAVLLELWDLIGTPVEERFIFENVTSSIAASESEITEPNMLSIDFINGVESEVCRLNQLKSSKVKELLLKKRLELEEMCRNHHMVTESLTTTELEATASWAMDPMQLLEKMELEISKFKEEALSRKEILDKVEKWWAACEEESWLEEYNRDENRYNAGRGAHLTLKRAEKARAIVNKIPAMMEALTAKTKIWEKERGVQFLYDGELLLSRLEAYNYHRKEKEQERIKQRDQKKRQVQLIAEQEALFGAKPSPSKSGKKPSIGVSSDRKLSLGGSRLQNFKAEKASPCYMHSNKIDNRVNQNSCLDYQQYAGFKSQNFGRRTSVMFGDLIKQHSSAKTRQSESHIIRKPLSPIPLTMSSKANMANFPEDQKQKQDEKLLTAPCTKTPIRTPTKQISSGDEVTKTPNTLPALVPSTPSTTSAPMLMASTPATPYVSSAASTAEKVVRQIEYSFEEVRAGFIYPEAQTHKQLQV